MAMDVTISGEIEEAGQYHCLGCGTVTRKKYRRLVPPHQKIVSVWTAILVSCGADEANIDNVIETHKFMCTTCL